MDTGEGRGPAPVLILCPYCLSPVEIGTVVCDACGFDTTKDAKIEVSREAYAAWERTACPVCGGTVLKLANPCPHCGAELR